MGVGPRPRPVCDTETPLEFSSLIGNRISGFLETNLGKRAPSAPCAWPTRMSNCRDEPNNSSNNSGTAGARRGCGPGRTRSERILKRSARRSRTCAKPGVEYAARRRNRVTRPRCRASTARSTRRAPLLPACCNDTSVDSSRIDAARTGDGRSGLPARRRARPHEPAPDRGRFVIRPDRTLLGIFTDRDLLRRVGVAASRLACPARLRLDDAQPAHDRARTPAGTTPSR